MRKLAWIVAAVILPLGTAELFFRVSPVMRGRAKAGASRPLRLRSAPTEFAPYVDGFNAKNVVSENLHTNSLGFRTQRELTDKQPQERRIFVLGGSAAIGWGASSDETTFALQLEQRLHAAGSLTSYVFNAGCDGYNSNQEWVLMATLIMDLNPDLIILFNGYNDMYYSMAPQWTPQYNIYSAQVLNQISFHPFYLHSALLRFIESKTRLNRIRRSHIGMTGELRPEFLDVYLKNLEKIGWAARRSRAAVLVVLQPHFLVSKKNLTDSEKQILKTGHDYKMYKNYATLVETLYSMAQTKLAQLAPKSYWSFVDANRWFEKSDEHLFLDEVHLTDRGHSIVAQNLAEILTEHPTAGKIA